MAILNLAMVRKHDWEEHALVVGVTATETHTKAATGKWLYRGELEAKLGKGQTRRFLMKGKYEKGEDSDGDSVYRKIQKSDSYSKSVVGYKTVSSSGAVNPDDMQKLQDELFKFKDDATFKPKTKGKVPEKKLK